MACYSHVSACSPALSDRAQNKQDGWGMNDSGIGARVHVRLALPCILFMLMSSLDRANISFAASAMNADLGFTPSQYGFGAGVLFAGFLLGQYPSLWLLQCVGMRRWMASCALLWGLAVGALGLVHSFGEFC